MSLPDIYQIHQTENSLLHSTSGLVHARSHGHEPIDDLRFSHRLLPTGGTRQKRSHRALKNASGQGRNKAKSENIMNSANSRNSAPEAQGPPAGQPPMLRITLNNGRITEHRDADLPHYVYARLQPLLQQLGGPVPGMPGFAVAWCYIGDTVLMELVHGTVRVAECGLAWGPQEASTLWEFLGLTAAPLRESTTASLNTPAPSMPRPPWLAVVSLRGAAELSVLNAVSLSGFECFLGLALLRHRLQRN